jgi:hypothetical protein
LTGLRRTFETVTGQKDNRPWWKRGAWRLAGAIALPAIAWVVVQGLDEGKQSLKDEPPINISVVADASRVRAPNDPGWEPYGFVSPSAPAQLGRPPSELCREWRAWALDNGGVDADQTRLYAFLQGKATTAVAITGLDVEFARRGPAVKGTHAWCPTGGAVGSPRLVDIDLDAKPPAVRYAETGDDYPSRDRLLLTLNGTETETLEVTAHTRSCDCEWRIRLRMVINGKSHDALIDDDGKPFRTSASAASSHVTWNGRRWEPMSRSEWKKTLPMRWADFRPPG